MAFTCLEYKWFENSVGKGEIARNEQFLFFPQGFLSFLEKFPPLSSDIKLWSANSFNLEESKICWLEKGCINLSQTSNFRLSQTEKVNRQV